MNQWTGDSLGLLSDTRVDLFTNDQANNRK